MDSNLRYTIILLVTCLAACSPIATAKEWVRGWYGDPIQLPDQTSCGNASSHEQNVFPAQPIPSSVERMTLRTTVHLPIGGGRLRLRMSNLYGCNVLAVDSVQVIAGTENRMVTFNGRFQLAMPAHSTALSDPVDLLIPDGINLEVRASYPRPASQDITFTSGAEANVLVIDEQAGRSTREETPQWLPAYFLAAVDVERESVNGAIVAIGDSITAGGSYQWPALLADRLLRAGMPYSVVNAGIGGNRLLRNSPAGWLLGERIVDRFQRDVLDQPHVKYVILYAGINDLGLAKTALDGSPVPASEKITEAICDLSARAHQHGLKLYVATLAPFEGAAPTPEYYTPDEPYYTAKKDDLRREINTWVRQSRCIDGYFDFERALADPEQPNRLNPEFDSGDHLHPNPAGQRALGNAIHLSSFE